MLLKFSKNCRSLNSCSVVDVMVRLAKKAITVTHNVALQMVVLLLIPKMYIPGSGRDHAFQNRYGTDVWSTKTKMIRVSFNGIFWLVILRFLNGLEYNILSFAS